MRSHVKGNFIIVNFRIKLTLWVLNNYIEWDGILSNWETKVHSFRLRSAIRHLVISFLLSLIWKRKYVPIHLQTKNSLIIYPIVVKFGDIINQVCERVLSVFIMEGFVGSGREGRIHTFFIRSYYKWRQSNMSPRDSWSTAKTEVWIELGDRFWVYLGGAFRI